MENGERRMNVSLSLSKTVKGKVDSRQWTVESRAVFNLAV
jgi:hypothetical protein